MIRDVANSFSAAPLSLRTAKNSASDSAPSLPIDVYMLDEICIYSGGGRNGQTVNVMYTPDSTAENPTVKIFGHSLSGDYEEVVHINDIDPTNATYAELCALLAHQHRIGAYKPVENKLLRPAPIGLSPDYSKRMDYVSLIREHMSDTDAVYFIDATPELLDFYERYLSELNERSKKEESVFLPAQIDYVGRFRVEK